MHHSPDISRVLLQYPYQLRPRLLGDQNDRGRRDFPLIRDKLIRETVSVVKIDEYDSKSGRNTGHHGEKELEAVLVCEAMETIVR